MAGYCNSSGPRRGNSWLGTATQVALGGGIHGWVLQLKWPYIGGGIHGWVLQLKALTTKIDKQKLNGVCSFHFTHLFMGRWMG